MQGTFLLPYKHPIQLPFVLLSKTPLSKLSHSNNIMNCISVLSPKIGWDTFLGSGCNTTNNLFRYNITREAQVTLV